MSARQTVHHGRVTVSWGPVTYGEDRIMANCPVDAFPDLIAAVSLAHQQFLAGLVRDESRDVTTPANPPQRTGG